MLCVPLWAWWEMVTAYHQVQDYACKPTAEYRISSSSIANTQPMSMYDSTAFSLKNKSITITAKGACYRVRLTNVSKDANIKMTIQWQCTITALLVKCPPKSYCRSCVQRTAFMDISHSLQRLSCKPSSRSTYCVREGLSVPPALLRSSSRSTTYKYNYTSV